MHFSLLLPAGLPGYIYRVGSWANPLQISISHKKLDPFPALRLFQQHLADLSQLLSASVVVQHCICTLILMSKLSMERCGQIN